MNTVEGFFAESGLFLKCPHCKNSTRQNVQSFFLSIHMNKPVTCTKCEKTFTIHVELRPFVEAVEHGVQADKCPSCENGIIYDAEFDKWFNCSDCAGTGIRR